MVRTLDVIPNPPVNLAVLCDTGPRLNLLAPERIQCRLLHDLADQVDAATPDTHVVPVSEVVEDNPGIRIHARRVDADLAPAPRLVRSDVDLETVAVESLGTVVAHGCGEEVKLDIRPFLFRAGADERTGLEVIRAAQPVPEQQPAQSDQRLAEGMQRPVQGDRLPAPVLTVNLDVILKVFPHTRQFVRDGNARVLKHIPRPDPGSLQQDRRTDGAGRQDDFPGGNGLNAPFPAVKGHSFCGTPVEHDLVDVGARDDGQVSATPDGRQVGPGARHAHPVPDGHLHRAEPFLLIPVAVIGAGITGLNPRVDERLVKGIAPGVVAAARAHRTVAAAPGIGATLPALGAAEVGQAIAIVPTRRAKSLPFVEVSRVPAHVDHAVDRRRAAEHLALRAVETAAAQARLRLGDEAPVESLDVHRLGKCRRHADEQTVVATAGLDEEYPVFSNGGKPVRQHATRRPGANDDVVVVVSLHGSPCKKRIVCRYKPAGPPEAGGWPVQAGLPGKLRREPLRPPFRGGRCRST